MRRFLTLLVTIVVIGATVQSSPRAIRTGAAVQRQSRFLTPSNIYGRQHDGHTAGNGGPLGTVLAVDGAANPAAVSDERAYDLFLASMAKATADRTLDIALGGAGLTREDRLAFRDALGALDSELKTLQVDLIRFRGHLPKGGYDVPNGGITQPAVPSALHR